MGSSMGGALIILVMGIKGKANGRRGKESGG